MRWSNQMIQPMNYLNESKLSSRSQSKFKKVNLHKQLTDKVGNMDKQLLKLSSVEKIKKSQMKSSRISDFKNQSQEYLNKSGIYKKQCKNINQSNLSNTIINNSNKIQLSSTHNILTKNINLLDSMPSQTLNYLDSNTYQTQIQQNNITALDLSKINHKLSLVHKLSTAQTIKLLHNVLKTLNIIAKSMQQICRKIIIQINNQNLTYQLNKLENELKNFVKQYSVKFQTQMLYATRLRPSLFSTRYNQDQNIRPNQFSQKGPNAFKNYFKSILRNNNYNNKNEELVRKNTEPFNSQDSSFFSNSNFVQSSEHFSNILDSQKNSSRIKFNRSKEKRVSKSVKKLQQKIVSLKKNMLNQCK